ncbi:hypothetical protein C8R45DRAFT_1212932, partial [Mycena sanguinolenta]
MPPYRMHEAMGAHQMALQATCDDPRDRHRHAVNFGLIAVETSESTDQHHARHGIYPVIVPPSVLRRLPPLPALSPHAPSLGVRHHYTSLRLANLGSGNYH